MRHQLGGHLIPGQTQPTASTKIQTFKGKITSSHLFPARCGIVFLEMEALKLQPHLLFSVSGQGSEPIN